MNPAATQVDFLAIATRLAKAAGRAQPRALQQLAGGRNNRVFRVETGGVPLVLKSYFKDPRDVRDRLGAEWAFLTHAWKRGVQNISEPLASDPQEQAGLYSFVAGRKLNPDEIDVSYIDAAADFVLAVNRAPRDLSALPVGSEACFSLAQHLSAVERRIERLDSLDPDAPQRDDAARFIANSLLSVWADVKARTEREILALGLSTDKTIRDEEICISPSDFGFHNALIDAGKLTFLDFEYAGRDDPAKLTSDFLCQPEIPIPAKFRARFVSRMSDGLPLSGEARARCKILLDVYRVKWTCILLNEFLEVGAARRAYASADERAARCASQLGKALAKLAEVESQ